MRSVRRRGSGRSFNRSAECKNSVMVLISPSLEERLTLNQPMIEHHALVWNDTDTPLAYFISFRSYGTWLHGDKRGSIDRFHNRYKSPYMPASEIWHDYNQQRLRVRPLILKAEHRKLIEKAIRETCNIRKWWLYALNVRTNHIHTVVTANRKATLVLNAFKANATRELRQNGLWSESFSPWARRGSKKKLWTEQSVARAIDYVLNGQGDDLPDFDD